MDGGDGDDFIELRGGTLSTALAANVAGLAPGHQPIWRPGATSNDRNVDVVTVDGGAGNDRIILTGVASATINAGSGTDLVSISMRGATSVNNYLLTLGRGADIIQLGVGVDAATSTDVAATARTNRVTDFERGNAGDKFEMTNFLNLGLTGYTANSNAFASGHLRLVQSGTRPAAADRSRRRRRDQRLRDRVRDQQRLHGRVHGLQLRRLHRQPDADGLRASTKRSPARPATTFSAAVTATTS